MNAEKGLPKMFLLGGCNEYFGRPSAETVHGINLHWFHHSHSFEKHQTNRCFSLWKSIHFSFLFHLFQFFYFYSILHLCFIFFIWFFFYDFILKQMKILLETKIYEWLFSHDVLRWEKTNKTKSIQIIWWFSDYPVFWIWR